MMTPRPKPVVPPFRIVLRRISIIVLSVGIIGYGLFVGRHLINGPSIVLESPTNGQSLNDNFIELTGRARNAVYTAINGRPISIDTKGKFKEQILLPSGVSNIQTVAKDRYGREDINNITVIVP